MHEKLMLGEPTCTECVSMCHFYYIMVLALVFGRQKNSLVTEQRLRSALTSFGIWPRSRCSVTKEILKPFKN
jgi:hypothetical protein